MLRSMIMLGLMGLTSLPCLAQSNAAATDKSASTPKTFFQLNFAVQELENDRVINSRSYSMIMRNEEPSSIRAGEKVPFASSSGNVTEWQQLNVGVDIDCRNLEVSDKGVSLNVKADISSVMVSTGSSTSNTPPVIRNNQWGSNVVLPLKQPTVLFSSDDPASKRTMRLQLTVSPVKQ